MRYILNILWSNLLLLSYLAFSYYYFNGWWYSSIGTILILFFSYLIWRKDFIKIIGLKLTLREFLITIALTIGTILGSLFLIKHIGLRNNISIHFTSLQNYYHDIFYILNEEIVLGSIPIYLLISRLKIKSLYVSIGLALVFTMVHYVFYKWIFLERGIIEIQTLTTLFLVGIVRNNLIIVNKHIGYSWALHFGWMVVLFGCLPEWVDSGKVVTEPDRFNLFLGSHEMLIISIFLAGISIFHIIKKLYITQPKQNHGTGN